MLSIIFSTLLLTLTLSVSALPLAARKVEIISTKRGIAYDNPAFANMLASSYNTIGWAYNWADTSNRNYPSSSLSSAVEFIPMLHTPGEVGTWAAAADAAIASGAKHMLFYNEPDLAGLTPASVAVDYMTHMQPYAGKIALGAPAVTGQPSGITWLTEFMTACVDCRIDFVPVHWYDSATNVGWFTAFMLEAKAAAFGRPVWITEFAARGTEAQEVAFLRKVLPWLDGLSWVGGYSWFMATEDNGQQASTGEMLIAGSGSTLSTVGNTFATITGTTSVMPVN